MIQGYVAARAAIKVYQDQNVPLTKTADDGSAVDVLFWTIRDLDGWPAIIVHPDRWDAFTAASTVTTVCAKGPETGANCRLPDTTDGDDEK